MKSIFAALAVLSLATPSIAAVNLSHYNATLKTWTPYQVKALNNIDNIYTSGHYAWIIDSSNGAVAFYNGTTWDIGAAIPGITSVSSISPGFDNGTAPVAWAKGDGKLAYFDGKSWMTYNNIIPETIMTLGGNIWIKPSIWGVENNNYFLYTDYKDPMNLKKIDYRTNHKNAIAGSFTTSGTDDNPTFLVLFTEWVETGSKNVYIAKYLPDGTEEIIFSEPDLYGDIYDYTLNANGNEIILSKALGDMWYSKNNGSTWTTHKNLGGKFYAWSDLLNGKLCGSGLYDASYNGLGYDFCQNLDNNIDNIVIFNYQDFAFESFVKESGFVTPNNYGVAVYYPSNPVLLEFDYQTGQRTDLKPDLIATRIFSSCALPNHRYMACGIGKKTNRMSAFYYDGKSWSSKPINDTGFCTFSKGSQANGHGKFYLPNEDLWIYSRKNF